MTTILDALYRCSGNGCPSREICRRHPTAGERRDPLRVMTALWVRRPRQAAACDQYVPRDCDEPEYGHAA